MTRHTLRYLYAHGVPLHLLARAFRISLRTAYRYTTDMR